MMPTKIEWWIAEKGYKKTAIAEKMGISMPTFRRKLSDVSLFTVTELKVFSDLGMTAGERLDIFNI